MGQVAQAEGAERIAACVVVDLLAHMPVVAMPAHGSVILGYRTIGRDVAIEEVERKRPQQVGHGGGEEREVFQDALAQVDVSGRRPRVQRVRQNRARNHHYEQHRGHATQSHRRRLRHRRDNGLNNLRVRLTVRRVAAMPRAVSSTSS